MSLSAGRTVDAEKHCGTGKSVVIQQVAHRAVGGAPGYSLLASDVHGELGGIRYHLCRRCGETSTFKGDEPALHQPDGALGQPSHLLGGVDRGDGDGEVLGHAQRLVATQLVSRAESGHAAQDHAGRHRVLGVEVEQLVGDEAFPVTLSFSEVAGELEDVVAHSALPIHSPSHAAVSPRMTLTTTFARAPNNCRSSASRCVSSIHVEKVVYEPTNAVPARSATCGLNANPPNSPSRNAPLRFTASVPNGNRPPTRADTARSTRKRSTAPNPPMTRTPAQIAAVIAGSELGAPARWRGRRRAGPR